jgi:hypothetical protein
MEEREKERRVVEEGIEKGRAQLALKKEKIMKKRKKRQMKGLRVSPTREENGETNLKTCPFNFCFFILPFQQSR